MPLKPEQKTCQDAIHHRTLKDFTINVLYIAVLCTIVHGLRSPYRFHMTKSLRRAFVDKIFSEKKINFLQIACVHDVWEYLNIVTLPILFYEIYPNGAPVEENELWHVLLQNRLLGFPRLRQVKVRNDSCIDMDILRKGKSACYGRYSESVADNESFGPANSSAWVYHAEEEIGSSMTIGQITYYGGSGYFIDLGPTKALAANQLNVLKQAMWITQSTRAVILQFSTFNAEMNFFAVVGLIMEFPPSGGVFPSYQINTIPLVLYRSTFQQFILAFQILFVLYTAYYTWEELKEFRKLKWHYFMNIWNTVDLTVIGLSAAAITVYIAREIVINKLIQTFSGNLHKFVSFGDVAFWQLLYDRFAAVLVFLAWLKVFKYLSFNKTMAQLATTLSLSAIEIAGFGLMFLIVFIWYACVGYLLFGTQVHQYKTIYDAVMTLTKANLGDFHYREITNANSTAGSLFLVTYVFFVFFVLVNMFLAIITETYTIVKRDLAKESLSEIVNIFVTPIRKLQTKIWSLLRSNSKKTETSLAGVIAAAERATFETKSDLEVCKDPVTVAEYKRVRSQVNELSALIARLNDVFLPQLTITNEEMTNIRS